MCVLFFFGQQLHVCFAIESFAIKCGGRQSSVLCKLIYYCFDNVRCFYSKGGVIEAGIDILF